MEKVIGAGGIVINQYNELLMICRKLKWDLPKGHVEKNETIEACALREAKEETGLRELKIVRFIGITEHVYYEDKFKSEVIKEVHWFEMTADKKDKLHPQVEESIEWILWVSKIDIQNYLHN